MSRYVVYYKGNKDPSLQEESNLVSSLKDATIIDQMPGSLLVDAPEQALTMLAKQFTQWRFVPEVTVAVSPPRKRIHNQI